ncbi:MAG: hypothetical protein OXC03_05655 [Flavobacteriaceae bacterium]|nr:hypothetical protein [Flavobacteriaceae bacterium]
MNNTGHVHEVALESSQSGIYHANTINPTWHTSKRNLNLVGPDTKYIFSGTSFYCIKITVNQALNQKPPDLYVSVIKHGNNASATSFISGS